MTPWLRVCAMVVALSLVTGAIAIAEEESRLPTDRFYLFVSGGVGFPGGNIDEIGDASASARDIYRGRPPGRPFLFT